MKIRLEKPTVIISNLTGGKNEKARRGALHEKFQLDLYIFFTGNNECDMSTRGFLIEILLHIYNVQQAK